MGVNKVVERIRSLLARFAEAEETVRRLTTTDMRFNALCDEYRNVTELLGHLEAEIERLKERRIWLEEELLVRIDGHQPR